MIRDKADSQTTFLSTKKDKDELKKRSVELGISMSDLMRLSAKYLINNISKVFIVDYDDKSQQFSLKRNVDGVVVRCRLLNYTPEYIYGDKREYLDRVLIGMRAIVDFSDEKTARCLWLCS